MALPKQVEQQLREVEELEKRMQAQGESEGSEEEPTAELETADAQDPAPNEPEKPEEVTPPEQTAQVVPDDFEQKYLTLRGKYDAEVPRLHGQVKDLTKQLNQMQTQLEELKTKPEVKEPVSLVTEADKEAFGEDLLDVQRRVAKEVASEYEGTLAEYRAEIADLRKRVDATGSQVGEVSFDHRLAQLVPDFDKINTDASWVKWLDAVDPMSRAPRREAAQAAFARGDAEAVGHYVNLYKEATASAQPTNNSQNQAELEKQVTPSRSATSSATPQGSTKKVYSAQDAEKVWVKVRELNVKNQFDAAAKLEAEITAAYMEGRVRP